MLSCSLKICSPMCDPHLVPDPDHQHTMNVELGYTVTVMLKDWHRPTAVYDMSSQLHPYVCAHTPTCTQTLTNHQTSNRPAPVRGGILADDMVSQTAADRGVGLGGTTLL
jgi:hypothetical protein